MRNVGVAAIVCIACSSGNPPPSAPASPGNNASKRASGLGVQIDAPADAKLQESAGHAFVGNGTFKLNLFAVDTYSPASADDQRTQLEHMLGFVKLTHDEVAGDRWRFDYELPRGKAGTISRIHPGRALDCGVHGVTPEVAAAVAAACAQIKPL